MKFEVKHDVAIGTQVALGPTTITKSSTLGMCDHCDGYTTWMDERLNQFVCSEECCTERWSLYYADNPQAWIEYQQKEHPTQIEWERQIRLAYHDLTKASKDIIIVVHDQLAYLKQCIESVVKYTENFNLYIWDNASGPETQAYIESLCGGDLQVEIARSDANTGFVGPNNILAEWGKGEYIILLNSDTVVSPEWDTTMLALLDGAHYGQVGYLGGLLDEEGRGCQPAYGMDIDYVMGWCFAIKRVTFQKHGLFSKRIQFAYGEDADFSLRLKDAGERIYALYSPLVHHYGNRTVNTIAHQESLMLDQRIRENHEYIQKRWKTYLASERILARNQAVVRAGW